MNDEVIQDLKQFIKTTVGQTEVRLGQRIDNLTSEMQAGFAGVAEVIEAQAEDTNTQLESHAKQLSELSR